MARQADPDYAQLYREHIRRNPSRCKPREDWDQRAAAMNHYAWAGDYADEFAARMDVSGCATLLDVGCGPGTIALRIAPSFERVYGLDFSPVMLAALEANAAVRGFTHVMPILRAWEDDWSDIPRCDIVVASRCLTVPDMEAALLKLHEKARRRVYVTDMVGGRILDREVCDAIGREVDPFPDHLFVVNILQQLGIPSRLDYVNGRNRLAGCTEFEELLRKVTWSLGELSSEERERLRRYHRDHADRIGLTPVRWALVAWDVQPS
jgi:SAM-dependent methyltransferase